MINKKYRVDNKEQLKEYKKEHKTECFARESLKRIFTNWKGSRKESEKIIGYSLNNLKEHLSKFGDIKNKQNTVDHIIPISYLSKLIHNKEDLARWSNRLPNLMLLSKSENSSKHAKLTIEHIPLFHLPAFIDYCLELDAFVSSLSLLK